MFEVDGFWLTRFLFQRAVGGVYVIAFLVAANQFRSLCGERGLLPAPNVVAQLRFRDAPSIFFLKPTDRVFGAAAWTGVALSVLAMTGLSAWFGAPVSMAVWLTLWALYLSFVNVGRTFYGYGWETLLCETGFLAIFLGGAGTEAPAAVIWLIRWLLFRVMFGAGLIKLRGDPCWRDLTCLYYHYETQPLPNPVSWYLHRSPGWVHRAGVLFTHFAQLVVPWGVFFPGLISTVAGALIVVFQGMLVLSGNLSWLNWLTIVLAIACFDDGTLGMLLPIEVPEVASRGLAHDIAIGALVVLVAALSVRAVRNLLSGRQLMNASFEPLHLVNTYGAFGSVTRRRFEVVMEGTSARDPGGGARWLEYEFKGKPGDVARRPPWVAPYHLRIDWQMWFAAMSSVRQNLWVLTLAQRLLEGDAPTLKLLAGNPFPDAPPRHVRARLYRYRFTDPDERRRTGAWWSRELVGTYLQPVSLRSQPGEPSTA